uniref:Protein smoothened n=1 Tax=Globodera rostochiensis TaxID=31243 RepID=A0A914GXI3_GLORO
MPPPHTEYFAYEKDRRVWNSITLQYRFIYEAVLPTMAESVFFTCFLLLCLHLAVATGYPIDSHDSDIEEGNAQQRKAYRGMEPSEHAQVAKTLQRIKQDNVWWLHNSCMQGRGYTNDSGCTDKKPDKCFGIDISYKNRVEIDEGFPHWIEFLRNFPRCWRFIAPLVCVVHYRPCTHLEMNEQHKYVGFELFPAQLCKEMRLHCDCDARVRGAQKQDDCNLNFYSRKEPVQLMDQAKACLTPLVYVNTIEEAQRIHALPLVDECFIPCSSTIYGTQSLSTLNMFTFLCFFVVLMLALLVLLRGRLVCDFGMFICLLATVSTLFIALTFALSPFFGDDVVCLLNGKIRRYFGAFTLANGNDILCFLEATYLKLFLIFAFWASFIIVCNGFVAKSHNRFLLLQQITALCHLLVSSFITFIYREISIDPVSKVCHYFRFRTVWLNLADFLLVLLVAFFIFKLSKRKSLQRQLDFYGQLLTETEQNPSSLIGFSGKSCADTEHCGAEMGGRLPFWQRLFDELIRWIHPLFLLIVYFGCVLSFYMLTEKTDNESDLLTSQINCSLSALSTDKWKGAGHLKSCQIVPQSPLWYYANSLVMSFNLVLMLAVILGSMNCHKSDKSVTNGEEETEDDDKNEVELDIFTPTSENGTSEQRRNGLGLNYNNRSSVADSIGEQSSNGYAEIDCTAFALTNTAQRGRGKRQSGRKRRLNSLDRSNKARRKRELLMAGKNEADDPMLVQATDTSSVSESASTLYARRHQAPSSPVDGVAYSPCSPSQPHAVPAAFSSTPLIVVHWLHQYCPSGGLYHHQSDHQQEAEPERADFTTEKANEEEEESGEAGRGANTDAQNPYKVEEADEKSKDDEGNAEGDAESEYPISDEEEADDRDSNDFCSDSPDSIEELFWNESCQKAAQHQQPAKI